MKNKLIKCTIILVIVAALGAALWRLNSFEKTEMVSMKGYSYEFLCRKKGGSSRNAVDKVNKRFT